MAETNQHLPNEKHPKNQIARLVLLIVLAVLLVVFAIQNSHEVIIKLWFWNFRTSLALALVISILSGFLLSLIYYLSLVSYKNRIIRDKEKEMMSLRKKTGSTPESIS
jgi:uncharacterized integral membrane protein